MSLVIKASVFVNNRANGGTCHFCKAAAASTTGVLAYSLLLAVWSPCGRYPLDFKTEKHMAKKGFLHAEGASNRP